MGQVRFVAMARGPRMGRGPQQGRHAAAAEGASLRALEVCVI
ncbi:hypothetical protein AB0T83_07360 [Fluviibacterium sp. DFM31]|uniref:Uncharacterized protein n=1 Tax=Meridianimarinicoccus marinus TaxID=3231483 RepID=A0ABV3L4Y3_9RHOB